MATIKGTTEHLNAGVLSLLSRVADATNNPVITITSTWRSPETQARIMDENLSAGKRIRYKAPGREITALWDSLHETTTTTERRAIMARRIAELAEEGRRVSNHCVSAEQFAEVNILDVSKWIANPRDFTKALAEEGATVKILTPYTDTTYISDKVVKMASEPAIHIEIATEGL